MNIFLTGASGFIGSRFIEMSNSLFDDDRIIALTSQKIPGVVSIVHDEHYNYTRSDFLKISGDVDVLLLMGHFLAERNGDKGIVRGNVDSINNTIKLLECLPQKPKCIVFCSTIDVYGDNRTDIINEKSIVSPHTPYALSKLLMENFLEEWGEGNVRILRLSHIYGPGDSRNYSIPIWLQAEMSNEAIRIFKNPNQLRNCLYIDDCCRILAKVCKYSELDPVINVISRYSFSLKEIADMCAEISHNSHGVIIKEPSEEGVKGLDFGNYEKTLCKKYFGDEQTTFLEGLKEEYLYYLRLS